MKKSLLFMSIGMLMATTANAEVLGSIYVAEDGTIACHSGACGNSSDGSLVAFKLPVSSDQAQSLAAQMGKPTRVVFRQGPLFLSPEATLELAQQIQRDQNMRGQPPADAENPNWAELMKTRGGRFMICTFAWEPKSELSFINASCTKSIGKNVYFTGVVGVDNVTPDVGAFLGLTTHDNPEQLVSRCREILKMATVVVLGLFAPSFDFSIHTIFV